MWKNSVERALIAGVCLGALLWPYEAGAAPRPYDDRRVQGEKQTAQRSARPQPKQEQPSSQIPNIPPAQELGHFKQQILKAPSSEITSEQKKILIEILDTLHSVPRGRWIIENAPADLTFKVNQKRTSLAGSYAGIKGLSVSGEHFKRIQNAPSQQRREEICGAALTIAHEMTHAIQKKSGIMDRRHLPPQGRLTINKLLELHAILEETTIYYQLSSPQQQLTKRDWFYLLQKEKRNEGCSEQDAERFARTEFVKKYWQNNPATPIRVNGKDVFCIQDHPDFWNDAYNRVTYENLLSGKRNETAGKSIEQLIEKYIKLMDIPLKNETAGKSIEQLIEKYIKLMDIPLKSDFFLSPETTAFRVLQNKFVGYMDGIKRQEIMKFDEGFFEKKYENGELMYVRFLQKKTPAQEAEKRFSFEGGYAVYTIRQGKMNGLYREFDAQGKQILEVPMENGRANGTGWQIKENGEKETTEFKNAWSTNYLRKKYQRPKERE